MNKKVITIFIIAGICVLTGMLMKISDVKFNYIPTLIGMLLGLVGLGIFFEDIKKQSDKKQKKED